MFLVIDDDSDVAELIATIVRLEGKTCRVVTDSFEDLLDVERWNGVHGATIDYELHSLITGLTLMRWLKETLPRVARIAVTAHLPTPDLKRYSHQIVSKPFSADELLKAFDCSLQAVA